MPVKKLDQSLPRSFVILSPGFPASEGDSTCMPAQQLLIRALNHQFPDIKIVIVSLEYPFFSEEYAWHGNRVIPLDAWKKSKTFKLRAWWRAWRLLKKLRRKSRIAGIFSFWCGECALIGKFFAKRYHERHYTWILGQDARKGNPYIRWIRPHAEDLVAMSGFLVEEFFKNYGIRPAHIIPNGIDISLYPLHRPVKDIDILGVGSLIPLKQYDVFIQVVAALSKVIPDIKAVICGKGPEEHDLLSRINKEGLQNNISLVGEKPYEEVLQWMCRARVFLHTASYEGFGAVCIEALYAGAHVISFCDPMLGGLKHWHIVAGKDEMVSLALQLLQDPQTVYEPVPTYSMDDNAKKVMKLFDR